MTHTSSHRPPARILKVCLATFALALGITGTAQAATYNVTKEADTNDGTCDSDCSLREAVDEANGGDADTINLPAGQFILTRDNDLDLEDSDLTTITGAGAANSVVDGNFDNRVFDLDSDAKASMSGLTVTAGGDTHDDGQGIRVDGTSAELTLENVVVRDNVAPEDFNHDGTGVANEGGTVTIRNSVISNNIQAEDGGGLENDNGGTMSLTNVTVSNNNANDEAGGGIENDSGTLTITNSTISGNRAGDDAGGIENDNGTLSITNSTLSGNRSGLDDTGGDGGAIRNSDDLTALNVTIANNRAGDDGGGVEADGNESYKNTIVANNEKGANPDDAAGAEGVNCDDSNTGSSQGHNLENPPASGTPESETCRFTESTDLRADPNLGPLQNNGGPTETHALQSGSPAIDSADNGACPSTDQRGVSRPQGPTCDRGSYEVEVAAATPPPAGPGPVARDTRRPRVSVAGLRRACVSRNFRIRVRLRDDSALRRVHVYLDGRRIVNTRRKSFSVRIRASRLRAGRHRIVIIARDVAGNRTRTVRRFRVCAARKVRRAPRFTG